MNRSFSDGVRDALVAAREEALRFKHDYVDAEHILLGLLREVDDTTISVFAGLDTDPDTVRQHTEEALSEGDSTIEHAELPYTPSGKKTLEWAMREARDLGQLTVGTEHLLLGLLQVTPSTATAVLESLDVTVDRAREVVQSLDS